MYPFPTLNHDQLLTLAHKTQSAARDHDRDRLEADALRLFQALADHLGAERPDLLQVAPADALLLERGQQRIVDLLVELAATAATDATDERGCRCDHLADVVLTELTLQANDERRHLALAHPDWEIGR